STKKSGVMFDMKCMSKTAASSALIEWIKDLSKIVISMGPSIVESQPSVRASSSGLFGPLRLLFCMCPLLARRCPPYSYGNVRLWTAAAITATTDTGRKEGPECQAPVDHDARGRPGNQSRRLGITLSCRACACSVRHSKLLLQRLGKP